MHLTKGHRKVSERARGLRPADLEHEGFLVDLQHLREAEQKALADQKAAERRFREWIVKLVPAAKDMNISSQPQIQQLLFGGFEPQIEEAGGRGSRGRKSGFIQDVGATKPVPETRDFLVENKGVCCLRSSVSLLEGGAAGAD